MSDDNRNIYLDNQGNYRDNTPENREQYPAADDGTLAESGEDTGAGVPPVAPAPADTATTRSTEDTPQA